MQYKIYLILIIVLHCKALKVLCNQEDNWIEPDAWSREKFEPNGCPRIVETCPAAATNNDNAIAFTYYKKFIANLFNREKLQHDKATELYQRSIIFTLTVAQLEKLESLNDARDLDTVLTEIFTKARTPKYISAAGGVSSFGRKSGFIWDILKENLQLLKTSEGQFALLVGIVILMGWHLHRRYNFGIIKMIICAVLIYGYFHTYVECNRKLESEQMLQLFDKQDKAEAQATPRWYTSILNWFSSSDLLKEKQKEEIRKMSNLNLPFCRPDHVFVLYANDLFFKQLEFLIEKCTTTIITLKDRLFFPFNYIAMLLVVGMICYVTKLIFKYILSPRAWASLLHNSSAHQYIHPPLLQHQQSVSAALTSGVAVIKEDRISGENLTLLLNALAPPSMMARNSNALPVSGVQDVLEQLKAVPTETTTISNSNTNSENSTPNTSLTQEEEQQPVQKTQNNNSVIIAAISKVKLEDIQDSLET